MSSLNKVLLEDVNCPFNCCKNDEAVLIGRDLLHNLPGEFSLVKCRVCGLMRTNPRPTPATIGFYYPTYYGPYIDTQVLHARHKRLLGIKKLLKYLIKWIFNFNTERLPALAPGRLLELGCASGSYLHQMAGQGWDVHGIEFSKKAAQASERLGYSVHAGSLEAAEQPPGDPFDLIVGWMVLEHLHDPIGGLNKLREWAKPGAWLVLSVPNAGALEFRMFKEKWYALQMPTHLYHFTPKTLEQLLRAGGWGLEKIYHHRILNNLIASIGYLLHDKGYVKLGLKLIHFPDHAGKWHYLLYPLAWALSVFGQTGRMTVWARAKQ